VGVDEFTLEGMNVLEKINKNIHKNPKINHEIKKKIIFYQTLKNIFFGYKLKDFFYHFGVIFFF
jgi:hypothetical protein